MIVKKLLTYNVFHKVRQLESFTKTNLFANSHRLPQFGRTSTTLANIKHTLYPKAINNETKHLLTKFPTSASVRMELNRKAGTINSDHVRLWIIERVVAVALPLTIPAALLLENAILDGIMSLLIVMHTHWGIEAIITDYARPIVVGPVVPKVLHFSLFIISAVTLCGLLVLINDGPGVARAIKDFWGVGKEAPKEEEPEE